MTEVKTVIIIVHGSNRASGLDLNAVAVGVDAVDDDTIAIVAPSFPDRPCTASKWTGNSTASKCAPVWARRKGWSKGYESDAYDDCPKTISSYVAMDRVLDALPRRYPRLSQIVLVGFSAGGEFAQKWALLSPQGEHGTTTQGVALRIIAGASPEYVYLDGSRPDPSCNQGGGSIEQDTCKKFRDVHAMHWKWNDMHLTDGTCNRSWDSWPYGLACLQNSTKTRCSQVGDYAIQGLHQNRTDSRYHKKRSSGFRRDIMRRFVTKDFRLSVGIHDSMNCAAGDVCACSDKCPSMLQGRDRLQRALHWVAHTNRVLAPYNYCMTSDYFDAGHEPEFFYRTDVFKSWVFGPGFHPNKHQRILDTEAPKFNISTKLPSVAALYRQFSMNQGTSGRLIW
jgi:pimeloyl-ACP methyl ester carboxylesterase